MAGSPDFKKKGLACSPPISPFIGRNAMNWPSLAWCSCAVISHGEEVGFCCCWRWGKGFVAAKLFFIGGGMPTVDDEAEELGRIIIACSSTQFIDLSTKSIDLFWFHKKWNMSASLQVGGLGSAEKFVNHHLFPIPTTYPNPSLSKLKGIYNNGSGHFFAVKRHGAIKSYEQQANERVQCVHSCVLSINTMTRQQERHRTAATVRAHRFPIAFAAASHPLFSALRRRRRPDTALPLPLQQS
jgi:hypothetical protein